VFGSFFGGEPSLWQRFVSGLTIIYAPDIVGTLIATDFAATYVGSRRYPDGYIHSSGFAQKRAAYWGCTINSAALERMARVHGCRAIDFVHLDYGQFLGPRDTYRLRELTVQNQPGLCILDNFRLTRSGTKTDGYEEALELRAIAEECEMVIVGIIDSGSPGGRTRISAALRCVASNVLVCEAASENFDSVHESGTYQLVRSTSKSGPAGDGFYFQLESEFDGAETIPTIKWGPRLDLPNRRQQAPTDFLRARILVHDALEGNHGAMLYRDLETMCRANGIHPDTLRDVKQALRIPSRRRKGDHWAVWFSPSVPLEVISDYDKWPAHVKAEGPQGGFTGTARAFGTSNASGTRAWPASNGSSMFGGSIFDMGTAGTAGTAGTTGTAGTAGTAGSAGTGAAAEVPPRASEGVDPSMVDWIVKQARQLLSDKHLSANLDDDDVADILDKSLRAAISLADMEEDESQHYSLAISGKPWWQDTWQWNSAE
jgi:hypothetical protein